MRDDLDRSAVLSDDGRYRYHLRRAWADGGRVLWIMLNPSTADAAADDPTIRRIIGFAQRWGHGAIEVVNLFAFRTTKAAALRALDRTTAIGPKNDAWLRKAVGGAPLVVAAWGNHGALHHRADEVRALLTDIRPDVQHLGLTQLGEPRHPLYVPYGASLEPLFIGASEEDGDG